MKLQYKLINRVTGEVITQREGIMRLETLHDLRKFGPSALLIAIVNDEGSLSMWLMENQAALAELKLFYADEESCWLRNGVLDCIIIPCVYADSKLWDDD